MNIEDKVYNENPPSWEEFKQAIMDEFVSIAERQNQALQFERLRQIPRVSVLDYALEFLKLRRYPSYIVPTEDA